jgi:microcystin-dependent protein
MYQYLSEIRIFSFNYAPSGWTQCNGQLLAINTNQPLFSLIGTTYGGDGIRTFALPNLQGRSAIHLGSPFTLGMAAGEAAHSLVQSEIPAHNHNVMASSKNPDTGAPTGNYFATNTNYNVYSSTATSGATMNAAALSITGSSLPHENMSPYLTLCFGIALTGIFPSKS